MRITILTLGTRGDVQPYIALGLGLQQAGHSVRLATSKDFEGMVASWGLPFAPLSFAVREFLEQADNRAAFESKRAALRMYKKVGPMMRALLDDAWAAAQGAEAILYHPKILNGIDIAEKLNIPSALAFYLPALSPTTAFPAPMIPGPTSWGSLLNKLSHHLFLGLMLVPFHRLINQWRIRVLGLPPRSLIGATKRRYGTSVLKIMGSAPIW
jgi:sterol 3beta-glucosyltransferase